MAQVFHYQGAVPAKAGASSRVLMIATPVLEKAFAVYTFSLAATTDLLARSGVRYCVHLLTGCCHVDDARNIIIRDFLETDCTDLLFIDADLRWNAADVLRILEVPGDIVAGIYPHKSDTGTFPFHPYAQGARQNEHGLFEMPKAATGFMRIRREVLEKLAETERKMGRFNYQFGAEGGGFGQSPIPRIVERGFIDEMKIDIDHGAGGGYQSGDYVLCLKARAAGFKVYVDPEMRFGHAGEKVWFGSFADTVRLQEGLDHPAFTQAVNDLRAGKADKDVFSVLAATYPRKEWPLTPSALHTLWYHAKATTGDVLETGSGLSTLVLGLALAGTDRMVHALEHDVLFLRETEALLQRNHVPQVTLHYAPLWPFEDGTNWYSINPQELPESFGLALIDGPPHKYGRAGVLAVLGDRLRDAVLVIDDAEREQVLMDALDHEVVIVPAAPRAFAIATPRKTALEAAE